MTGSTWDFSGRVVHDLKGPLASMRANLQFTLGLDGLPGEAAEALRDTLDGIDALQRILVAVGEVSSDKQLIPRRSQSDLAALLERLRQGATRRARVMRQEIELTAPTPCTVPLDVEQTTRVINTLLDNALRYAPSGSRIRLSLTDRTDAVELRIEDDGPPLPTAAQAQVLSPLGDLDPALAQLRVGPACSLPFCRRVLEAHDGSLALEAGERGGNAFVLTWPKGQRP